MADPTKKKETHVTSRKGSHQKKGCGLESEAMRRGCGCVNQKMKKRGGQHIECGVDWES